jgi:hypothetical protein
LELWNYGTPEPGTSELWNLGTLEPWNLGTWKEAIGIRYHAIGTTSFGTWNLELWNPEHWNPEHGTQNLKLETFILSLKQDYLIKNIK